jgi:hypothetical protein
VSAGITGGDPKERGKGQFEELDDPMTNDEVYEEDMHKQILREAHEKPIRPIREELSRLLAAREKQYQMELDDARQLRLLRDRRQTPTLMSLLFDGQLSFEDYSSKLLDSFRQRSMPNRFKDVYLDARTREFKYGDPNFVPFEDEQIKKDEEFSNVADKLAGFVDGQPLPSSSSVPAPIRANESLSGAKQLPSIKERQSSLMPHVEKVAPVSLSNETDEGPLLTLGEKDYTTEQLAKLAARDLEWRMISYGLPPKPDYATVSIENMHARNKDRADLIFEDLAIQGLRPSPHALSNYMKVYSEAGDMRAVKLFNSFSTFGFYPSASEYGDLIRMYLRKNDFEAAIVVKEQMSNITPKMETFGMLMMSASYRDKLPEALLLLEEASKHGIKIEERYLRVLRVKMNKLGLQHPDLPSDPHQWIKDAKKIKWEKRHTSQRKIQSLRSALVR